MKYKIVLSNTTNGLSEYLQVISEDGFEVNVVLIGEFTIYDSRDDTEATDDDC